jgi:hypothetical protein
LLTAAGVAGTTLSTATVRVGAGVATASIADGLGKEGEGLALGGAAAVQAPTATPIARTTTEWTARLEFTAQPPAACSTEICGHGCDAHPETVTTNGADELARRPSSAGLRK